jgi:hypothetical protein
MSIERHGPRKRRVSSSGHERRTWLIAPRRNRARAFAGTVRPEGVGTLSEGAARPSSEGAGNAGCLCTRSLACDVKMAHELVTTGPPEKPGIPARNGFNGFLRALPGDRAFLSPSSARRDKRLRQLDASVGASGPHDFAVRNERASSCASPRPPHPKPYVRDDRETPLDRERDGAR